MVIHIHKPDPEERHLNRFPKGREGVDNDSSNCSTRNWSNWRRNPRGSES